MPALELIQGNRGKTFTKDEKLAICSGSASLRPEDRVELLITFASDPDPAIVERARNALLNQPIEHFVMALAREHADPLLFAYCSENLSDKMGIADALAKNSACSVEHLTRAANHLTSEGIQALLDNLERFTAAPGLIAAVCASTAATSEQRVLLDEMQKGALSRREIEEAAESIEPDVAKRESLMQRVAHMNVLQRLTLALKGGRSERMLLIRDPNKLVQRCVLQSPRLTDTEVEAFASMSNLSTEVLRSISMMRVFIKSYAVMRNLVNNPKTPLDVSLHLFPRLISTDLVKLTANKNIPETLRSTAVKLHRQRKMGGAGA
ncbi:MAG: hypothetical protein ACRD4C_08355 [Candidatus Acidiferrales bacterium]